MEKREGKAGTSAAGRSIAGTSAAGRSVAVILVLLILLLAASLIFFLTNYNNVNDEIDQERKTYIAEVSSKTADQISSTLNHLNNEAALLPAMLNTSDVNSFGGCSSLYAGKAAKSSIYLISDTGVVFTLSGKRASIDNRALLERVVFDKEKTFSYETDASRNDYWVFCYPCRSHTISGNNIVGTMMAYSADTFSGEFAMQLFGEQGYALMCRDDGSIQLRPKGADWIGYNLYATLISAGVPDADVREIQSSLSAGGESDQSVSLNGSRWLMHSERLNSKALGIVSNLVVLIPIEVITNRVSQGMQTAIYSSLFVSVISALIVILFVVIVKQNGDERRRREQEARVELALRTAEAKSDFLARMSHDIRTPLNAIIGLNYIAGQNESNPAVIDDCVKKLGASADYLLQILNDVLDMSKIGSGKLEISNTPFSMEALLRNLSTMIGPRAQEKGLRYSVDVPTDFGSDFIGDRLRISQVLMNLLTNAVKFTPTGGEVTLHCRVGRILEEQSELIFVVSDTGIGMSEEYMQRLFRPFEQESADTTIQYGGSGLGLSIVQSLLSLMDGTIRVESKKGKGSAFTVGLMLKTAPRANAAEPAEYDSDPDLLKGKHILLAEDNQINRQIAIAILSSMGLTVDTAENGRAALEKFLASAPGTYNAILTDIRMPVMDGYAFAAGVRASEHADARTIPIAALSANAFEEDVAESLKHGMNAHLRKPMEVEEIRRVLTRLLRESKKDRGNRAPGSGEETAT